LHKQWLTVVVLSQPQQLQKQACAQPGLQLSAALRRFICAQRLLPGLLLLHLGRCLRR
jgi:hypothetical protein